MRAALNRRIDNVRVLVEERKVDVNYTNGFGGYSWNALICGAMGGSEDVVRFLVEEGKANVNSGRGDETPLIAAVCEGNLGVVRYLVEETDVDINVKGHGGRTALEHCRCFKDRDEIESILLSHIAKPKRKALERDMKSLGMLHSTVLEAIHGARRRKRCRTPPLMTRPKKAKRSASPSATESSSFRCTCGRAAFIAFPSLSRSFG
mmetsp:Transcript_21530/g.40338  ORF Transcript_21530/g.40338 Transcript_21530/m.40338 type:complete len:206 (-) Transcript_21530:152-769(-)